MRRSFKSRAATAMVTAIWVGAVGGIIMDGVEDTITAGDTITTKSYPLQ
jgi:hypothetical protein